MPRDPVTMRVLGARGGLTACGTRTPSTRLARLAALAVVLALLLVLATAA